MCREYPNMQWANIVNLWTWGAPSTKYNTGVHDSACNPLSLSSVQRLLRFQNLQQCVSTEDILHVSFLAIVVTVVQNTHVTHMFVHIVYYCCQFSSAPSPHPFIPQSSPPSSPLVSFPSSPSPSIPTMASFLLFLFLFLFLLIPSPSSADTILATSVSSYAELLPARVALASAGRDGNLPPSTRYLIITPLSLPFRIRRLLSTDHVFVQRSHLPLIALFNLPASRVIYISPQTLVMHSLKDLLPCPTFCAKFNVPCSFSSSFMVLTPNATTYRQLLESAADPRRVLCHTPPDWLDQSACLLNAQYPNLLGAPVFDPLSPNVSGPLRLPAFAITQHFMFYPRLRWEVPTKGHPTVISFSSPSFIQPWFWWSYAFVSLSWKWQEYRRLLHEEQPSLLAPVLMLLLCVRLLQINFIRDKPTRRIQESALMLRLVRYGILGTCASWCLAVLVTPSMARLTIAVPVFTACRVAFTTVFWIHLGLFVRTHVAGEGKRKFTSLFCARLYTLALAAADVMVVFVILAFAHVLPAETGYKRIFWLLNAVVLYCATVLRLLATLYAVWSGNNEKDWTC